MGTQLATLGTRAASISTKHFISSFLVLLQNHLNCLQEWQFQDTSPF